MNEIHSLAFRLIPQRRSDQFLGVEVTVSIDGYETRYNHFVSTSDFVSLLDLLMDRAKHEILREVKENGLPKPFKEPPLDEPMRTK